MLASQTFSSSGSDKYTRLYTTTIQDNQAISPTGIVQMYKHPVTLINAASFLGPSRTGIIYPQSC
jgi:hypothetical protein